MSKLYYDHLIVLDEVEAVIKRAAKTQEEKEELWKVVDETLHHRVMGKVLDKLPREHHEEFLDKFHASPHDVEELIRQEIGNLAYELLQDLKKKK
ncbi:MAG: hypothetical protein UT23_C0041G0008 [Candidatus Woesebacteria bacterium GW2011_GWA1_39_12]|uniref:Uncharacterized protein n=1 Tax=Candidatus Woesebacteria bacterium GW2011_GWA1_39_12 TaxID=1618549 RepID=A0A0G0LW09_9BACT|nr:MAG: hypothetical protein UT23_C0041G0008 [Candidatus Woesebacteria bacterium GW2011_GWA1_39_12]